MLKRSGCCGARWIVLAGLVLLGEATAARGGTVLTFAQASNQNMFSATNSGGSAGTPATTSLNVTDGVVNLTYFTDANDTNGTTVQGFLNFNATNIGQAMSFGGLIIQEFAGTFSFTSAMGDTGTNYLSGSFSDAVSGRGSGASLNASTPPDDSVTYTSDVIDPTQLGAPRAIGLTFTNITPTLSITNNSISSFTSNVSGNFSATATPEPVTWVLVASGLPALIMLRRRKSA